MPKIIEELKEKLLSEAKRQTLENGYANVTVRSVVKACGVSVGTFYNYYPSKEMLTAAFLLEDWTVCLEKMRAVCGPQADAMPAFERVYRIIEEFAAQYARLFSDHTARSSASAEFYSRHVTLRGQISALIMDVCRRQAVSDSAFLPDFVAEALITWSVEHRPFDDVKGVIGRLFVN